TAPRETLFFDAQHPYTQALLSAVPHPDPEMMRQKRKERILLQGDLPSPQNPPTGCVFHTRCPHATEICKQKKPEFKDIGGEHFVACHLYDAEAQTTVKEATTTVPMADA
ncbi:MAG: oligopeptide/dipeptide ABC transporter ATP-binding protein, partial [Candidatus Sericytochromatia bacterium]